MELESEMWPNLVKKDCQIRPPIGSASSWLPVQCYYFQKNIYLFYGLN